MKKPRPEPRAGQVWRDRDPRMWNGDRRVRVTSTIREDGGLFVTYRQVVGLKNVEMGQTFRSRYERFQRAFVPIDLLEQPPSVDAVDPSATDPGMLTPRDKSIS
jgi:hypothetical protein